MNSKCKEVSPEITVSKIKEILKNIGINVVEKTISVSFGKLFSVRIVVEGTDIGTNGKGTTIEYALASAYGEFMERLENGVLPVVSKLGSLNYTDCVMVNIDSEKNNVFVKDVLSCGDSHVLMSLWEKINGSCVFKGRMFVEINSDEKMILPELFGLAYGTNGMAAGNTIEEAEVQAICEIFERYVARQIINGNIVPPTIDLKYLMSYYPYIVGYVNEIKQKGDFSVIIKECSLGIGLPVVGLFIVNKRTGKFFVNFGAHPRMEIALERVFTEFFQGKCLEDLPMTVKADMDKHLGSNNDLRLFKNGCAFFSSRFLDEKNDYMFSDEHFSREEKTNVELVEFLKNRLKKLNLKCYVANKSCLNFPCVRIIIPGMTTIFPQNKDVLIFRIMRNKARIDLKHYVLLSVNQKKSILYFYDYCRKIEYGDIALNDIRIHEFYLGSNRFYRTDLLFLLHGYLNLELREDAIKICTEGARLEKNINEVFYYKAMEFYITNKEKLCDVMKVLRVLFDKNVCDLVKITTRQGWFEDELIYRIV